MSISKFLRRYTVFARQCLSLLAGEKRVFSTFIVLAVVAALTEGLSVSLLVPLLEAQGGQGMLSKSTLLGGIARLLGEFTATERIVVVAFLLAVVTVLRNVLQYFVEVLGTVMPLRMERHLDLRGYSGLMSVEMAYIQESEYGELLSATSAWPQRVSDMLYGIATVISSLMVAVVYVVLMLAVSWRLTAFAIGFVVVMSLVLRWFTSKPLHHAGQRLSAAVVQVGQVVMESVTGMKAIRLTAAESEMTRKYTAVIDESVANRKRVIKLQAATSPLLSACGGLFISALLIGNALLQPGDPSTWIGSVLLFLFLLFRLMGPISQINANRVRIVSHINAFDMLNVFFQDVEARRQPNGTRVLTEGQPAFRDRIVFENVEFTYSLEDKRALDGISIEIPCGSVVALVGPSGSGKSTLVGLLTRLYDPQKGGIFIDGIDIASLDLMSWRKRLAVVTQDNFMFNDTVTNNIRFGRADASLAKVHEAARLAAADEFVSRLPKKFDTMLGDRGVRLSGGEQQRIAIARAVLAAPEILIMDEATSNLDTFSERAIQNAMQKMSEGRTLIVIAHRLSTIRKADKVIVMENGRVVEEGRHDDLLNRRGPYWRMVEHQRLDIVDDGAALEAPVEI